MLRIARRKFGSTPERWKPAVAPGASRCPRPPSTRRHPVRHDAARPGASPPARLSTLPSAEPRGRFRHAWRIRAPRFRSPPKPLAEAQRHRPKHFPATANGASFLRRSNIPIAGRGRPENPPAAQPFSKSEQLGGHFCSSVRPVRLAARDQARRNNRCEELWNSASDDGDSVRKPSQIILSVAIEPSVAPPTLPSHWSAKKRAGGSSFLRDQTLSWDSGARKAQIYDRQRGIQRKSSSRSAPMMIDRGS